MPPEASIGGVQSTRWPCLRSSARHPGFMVRTWRSGPVSAFRMRFEGDSSDAIQQIHVRRVSLGRGGEGLFEGFTDGVRYKLLRRDFPMVVIAWWPSETTMLREEAEQLRRRLKATKRREVKAREQRGALRSAARELVDACGPLSPNLELSQARWEVVNAAWERARDTVIATEDDGGSTGGETP